MKEHTYKGNLILEYSHGVFVALGFNDKDNQDNIEDYNSCDSLEEAKKWLDDNGYSIEEE